MLNFVHSQQLMPKSYLRLELTFSKDLNKSLTFELHDHTLNLENWKDVFGTYTCVCTTTQRKVSPVVRSAQDLNKSSVQHQVNSKSQWQPISTLSTTLIANLHSSHIHFWSLSPLSWGHLEASWKAAALLSLLCMVNKHGCQ